MPRTREKLRIANLWSLVLDVFLSLLFATWFGHLKSIYASLAETRGNGVAAYGGCRSPEPLGVGQHFFKVHLCLVDSAILLFACKHCENRREALEGPVLNPGEIHLDPYKKPESSYAPVCSPCGGFAVLVHFGGLRQDPTLLYWRGCGEPDPP